MDIISNIRRSTAASILTKGGLIKVAMDAEIVPSIQIVVKDPESLRY